MTAPGFQLLGFSRPTAQLADNPSAQAHRRGRERIVGTFGTGFIYSCPSVFTTSGRTPTRIASSTTLGCLPSMLPACAVGDCGLTLYGLTETAMGTYYRTEDRAGKAALGPDWVVHTLLRRACGEVDVRAFASQCRRRLRRTLLFVCLEAQLRQHAAHPFVERQRSRALRPCFRLEEGERVGDTVFTPH